MQVMVSAVTKGAPVAWAPHVTLLLQNLIRIQEALSDLLSQLPCVGLTETKGIKIIKKKMEKDSEESQRTLQLSPAGWKSLDGY